LVEGHELVRYELRRMLEQEEDMRIVGDYANAEQALPQVKVFSPDIVIMDTNLPGMNGIEATRYLKRNRVHCDADVIILSDYAHHLAEALKARAADYLLKDVTHTELAHTTRETYWSKQLPEDLDGFFEESVELVIPPPLRAEAAQLLRSLCR
jgi:two-component system response regulator DegU